MSNLDVWILAYGTRAEKFKVEMESVVTSLSDNLLSSDDVTAQEKKIIIQCAKVFAEHAKSYDATIKALNKLNDILNRME